METLLERLRLFKFRAAIVGPEGSGKTTLQEDIAERLKLQGLSIRWLRLNRENRGSAPRLIDDLFRGARVEDLLFVDGAEQIGPLKWRLFKRQTERYGGLVINVHVAGRLPTLLDCRTSPELLHEIVCQLVPHNEPTITSMRKLFETHQGNLRQCLRNLYDQWAD